MPPEHNVGNAPPISIRFQLDRVVVAGNPRPFAGRSIDATAGDVIELSGWALDDTAKTGVKAVFVQVDGGDWLPGRARIARPELAAAFGSDAAGAGIGVSFGTQSLAKGTHRFRFVLTVESNDSVATEEFLLHLSARDTVAELRQIVVAGAPKSAGRYVASVLARYFGISANPRFGPMVDGEHVLTDAFIEPAKAAPFSFHCHPIARAGNLNLIARYGLQTVITWRNLGDVVISLDDHMCKQREGQWQNTSLNWIDDREQYIVMPEQKRYQFQIRTALPWYLMFYLTWRASRLPLIMRYEWMVAERNAYFGYLISKLGGTVDEGRLQGVLAPVKGTGFNVGVAGRSSAAFSDETKALLEQLVLEHPSDLYELWLEFPWIAETRKPRLASDGRPGAWLLADGIQRRADDHWLRNHAVAPEAIERISASELASYRPGANLY